MVSTAQTPLSFDSLLKSRHSVVNFDKDVRMTEEDFKRIFELTKLAPSVYNLQPTHYLVITDDEEKEVVRDLNLGQYKIHTASGIVLVMGDKDSLENDAVERIYKPMNQLGMLDDITYSSLLRSIESFTTGLKQDQQELSLELTRNACIHASFFMLSAKYLGFDTCPMHIHNFEELRMMLNIPSNLEPVMMIAIGKSVDKTRPRGYRKPVSEFVQFGKFQEI